MNQTGPQVTGEGTEARRSVDHAGAWRPVCCRKIRLVGLALGQARIRAGGPPAIDGALTRAEPPETKWQKKW